MFIADVTDPNHDVLFELGFAVAPRKRMWLLLDPAVSGAAEQCRRFSALSTIGYTPYHNSEMLAAAFSLERPDQSLDESVYNHSVQQVIATREQAFRGSEIRARLFLQSVVATDTSGARPSEKPESVMSNWRWMHEHS